MRGFDFSSWGSALTTLLGLALISVVAVAIRMGFMLTVQRRRERQNRQINERLRTLIAAYKTLGGSFTGELSIDPRHLRDIRREARAMQADTTGAESVVAGMEGDATAAERERPRRIRDAVEAALSDVILLGTEEQVRMASHAAAEMVAGHRIELAPLVVSLRAFVREALDLEPVPADLQVPAQGPLRPATGGRGGGRPGGRDAGGAARGGGGGGGGMGGGGAAMGLGMGEGAGAGVRMRDAGDPIDPEDARGIS